MSWKDELEELIEKRNLSNDDAYIEVDSSITEDIYVLITGLLKKQRENCADILGLYVNDDRIEGLHSEITNAPEPE